LRIFTSSSSNSANVGQILGLAALFSPNSTSIGGTMMYTLNRTATTDMEVTSIRLERELKEKLKELSGNQGYQALIRDVLWNYVQQKSGLGTTCSADEIRVSIPALANREERCVLTGTVIRPQESMLLGLTASGEMVPLSLGSLSPGSETSSPSSGRSTSRKTSSR
jgi:hypothetical protein